MTNTLYIEKRMLVMRTLLPSILLASAMLGLALLGNAGAIPHEVAQLLPFLLLALFAPVWLRDDRSCNLLKRSAR